MRISVYFLPGNVWESCHPFFSKQKQKHSCVQCCHGNLVTPSIFLLLFHYYTEIDTIYQ